MPLAPTAASRVTSIFGSFIGSLLCTLLPIASIAAPCDRSTFVITLDPGHGAAHPGAISARGVPEVRFNRALAKVIYEALQRAGFEKILVTDSGDDVVSLTGRAALANEHHADVFLSIHHDSVQPRYLARWTYEGRPQLYSDRFSGYSLFVSDKNPASDASLRLAQLIGSELRRSCLTPSHHHAEPIPGEGRERLDPWRGIYRFDDLVVLKSTRMPAVLLEAGLIVNRAEELALQTSARQTLLAAAVTTAIERFCARETVPDVARTDCSAGSEGDGTIRAR